jgi:putative RecB family exonuclease
MSQGNGSSAPVHLSKSILGTWGRCRLAYKYERVDRIASAVPPSAAQLRGTAAHAAVAEVLKGGLEPGSAASLAVIDRIVDGHGLSDVDRERVRGWVVDAARMVVERGGTLRWVEELFSVERTDVFTLWAKFDVAVVGGALAPLEVIDFTFGAHRVTTPEELASSIGARAYRLAAGHVEPDRKVRPIAITELHGPSCSTITIVPDDAYVTDAWAQMKAVAAEIRTARELDEFPATPGRHCGWCAHRDRCPIVTTDDIAPL